MLAARNRFHGHGSLRYVYKNGQAIRSRLITLKFSKNPRRKYSRIAVVVSKKVAKSAVRRNRIRRRVYEVIRQQTKFPDRHDLVFLVFSSEVIDLPSPELTKLVRGLLQNAQPNL